MVQDNGKSPGDAVSDSATPDGRRFPSNRVLTVLGLLATALATCALYVPFLGNKLIFDDASLFASLSVFDYAQTPFNLGLRTFPYFTLGFVEVTWHSIEAHRIVSLILHLLNVFMIYRLIHLIALQQDGMYERKATILGLLIAIFFALHPVAVYGAAYLVQRTIVLATFFSLLSIWFYVRALRRDSTADCITAGLMYTLAIFSKEHAIALPGAVVALSPIFATAPRYYLRKAGIYIATCFPSAIWVLLSVKGVVGTNYEPFVATTLTQMGDSPLLTFPFGRWLLSALTQARLFSDYVLAWVLPNIRNFSIDIRVDFSKTLSQPSAIVQILGFLICPFLALWSIHRRNRFLVSATGLLFVWILFLTELSTVRFQEPFVLYRNYLWAFGVLVIMVGGLSHLDIPKLTLATAISIPLLYWSAQDRLNSLADSLSVWNDAVTKLPSTEIAGADRIYYNRARELFNSHRYSEARKDIDKVVNISPDRFEAQTLLGQCCLLAGNVECANSAFTRAIALNDGYGPAHYGKGLIYKMKGQLTEALKELELSKHQGVPFAGPELNEVKQRLVKEYRSEK